MKFHYCTPLLFFAATQAFAGPLCQNALRTLVASGIVDAKLIRKNAIAYGSILDPIVTEVSDPRSSHAARKNAALSRLDAFDKNIDLQLGTMDAPFRSLVSWGCELSKLRDARDAAERYDYKTLLRLVSEARNELKQAEEIK